MVLRKRTTVAVVPPLFVRASLPEPHGALFCSTAVTGGARRSLLVSFRYATRGMYSVVDTLRALQRPALLSKAMASLLVSAQTLYVFTIPYPRKASQFAEGGFRYFLRQWPHRGRKTMRFRLGLSVSGSFGGRFRSPPRRGAHPWRRCRNIRPDRSACDLRGRATGGATGAARPQSRW